MKAFFICKVTLSSFGLRPKTGEFYGMDFSSIYHFAEKEKLQTRLRRVQKKVAALQRYAEFAALQREMKYLVVYEIWCFLPPNKLVLETVSKAREEGMPVEPLTDCFRGAG
ncbi:MAG: hypothetical protein AB2448_11300 [Moorella sp. (in: firmicutes)]